jgi:secondary thiamine-phosphate synthase enzyme
MKSFRKELWFNVPTRRAFINITPQVQECLRESAIREGLVLVNAMHITASVFINDDEPGLHQDYERWLEELAPHEPTNRYLHNRTGEDNGDAHLKRQVIRMRIACVSRGRGGGHRWQARFWPLGADLLRRV